MGFPGQSPNGLLSPFHTYMYTSFQLFVFGKRTLKVPVWEPPPEPEPPTTDERLEKLEAENCKLKSQLQMQAQQQEFLENCLLEMGDVVYA